jgi:transposase
MGAYSIDIREKIVTAYEAGNTSIRKVAERFMVTKRTVHRLVKQYRETGSLEPKKPGGKTPSCLEAHKDLIVSTVEEHPDWTLWQYCEEIGEKTGVYVSTVTMCLFLKRQNLTLKKKTYRSERIADAEGQQERLDYWQAVKDVKPENLIFIDETGIWEGMERQKARSLEGRRAFSRRGCYKGQKLTVIGAISIKGLVCVKTITGSMKGKDFKTFVKEDLCPKLNSEKVVVMDNLKAHKGEEVQTMITTTGAKILYLSRYSPDFNPIEMLWSVIKAFIRQFKPQTLDALQKVLGIFFLLLDKSFFRNWFTKCCYCIP